MNTLSPSPAAEAPRPNAIASRINGVPSRAHATPAPSYSQADDALFVLRDASVRQGSRESVATLKVVINGKEHHVAGDSAEGQVDALFNALHKAVAADIRSLSALALTGNSMNEVRFKGSPPVVSAFATFAFRDGTVESFGTGPDVTSACMKAFHAAYVRALALLAEPASAS